MTVRCEFCGQALTDVADAFLELVERGSYRYPVVDPVPIYSHARCGPDLAYGIPFRQLLRDGADDWSNHLRKKRWYWSDLDDAIRAAESEARTMVGIGTSDPHRHDLSIAP